ncbi:guanylate kinase [Plebeiibacterium sediminum]|uniref:Guanylate kinase n=1 Tax=Plebeiibacterium sediminum TaxID=2992112 RepID=A0AAE3M240_9BACT|nr:guanylate kinase [Plebeiobacterium sediminum]MCW3785405.1 guanylate kinase [Plebeiobacterium sediminum]
MTKKGKLIIFSAPSGTGKTTIVKHLLQKDFNMEFSISATTRDPRGQEKHGIDYYFLTPDEFRTRIDAGDLLEWEEVYTDKYYGTLKSEVERITSQGNNIVFDVDVVGGLNIKKMYGEQAIAIFIKPPSVQELKNRLLIRGTDSLDVIQQRLDKAEKEISYADGFDHIIVNDKLEQAISEVETVLSDFLNV